MAVIIEGNKIAREISEQIRADAVTLKKTKGIIPGLAVVLLGNDPASEIYVKRKIKACSEIGFLSREYRLPGNTSEGELVKLIDNLNTDDSIHGILVQLPLPSIFLRIK